ncbi:MAG: pirin family protein [Gammaproteobacteria bacterium]|nr:pirin family protein [Gammaproteobacteria bacterium]
MSELHGRPIERIIKAMPTSDGAGVRLFRSLGQSQAARLDPFLMLDEFRSDDSSDYIAGFPEHPHRGFETVTYMLAGRMRHRDHLGNSGVLESGGLQWMTAGRGIVHSEMPEQEAGLMHGFQLWINLPAAEKMKEPAYQEFDASQIPAVSDQGVTVRVIAGKWQSVEGPVRGISSQPVYLHVALDPGARFAMELPADHHAFVYLFEGKVQAPAGGFERLEEKQAGLFARSGERIELSAGTEPCQLLLLAAAPFNEPVAQYGPFVMNTREELEQAMRDFSSGNF